MPPGKMAAQAGHAFLGAYLESLAQRPDEAASYIDDAPGTKIVLEAPDLDRLLRARERARRAQLPCVLIRDRGHILPPHFDGSPIVTALGIGPVRRAEVRRVTGALPLVS